MSSQAMSSRISGAFVKGPAHVVFAAALALACVKAEGWVQDIGPEFRVNTTTTNDQTEPSVAGLTNGGFVVAWTSTLQDGSGDGVYAQRYNAAGERVGVQFRVNTFTTNHQRHPSVAGLLNGGFVVTWNSGSGVERLNQDGSGYGVYGQLYSDTGAAVGGEFLVNTTTANNQMAPAVAGISTGGFVVTWQSAQEATISSLGPGIYGQLYSDVGARVGSEFRINSPSFDRGRSPSVAAIREFSNNAGFVVTWTEFGVLGGDNRDEVIGGLFTVAGAPVGDRFFVNTYTARDQGGSSVAGHSSGGFVVSWYSTGQNEDLEFFNVYGQRYGTDGGRVGREFLVNRMTRNSQDSPAVAAFSNGRFLVAFNTFDNVSRGVYGQHFDAAEQVGGELRINSHTTGDQLFPAVAVMSDGGFVVVWASNGQDGSGWGVYGQRKGPPQ